MRSYIQAANKLRSSVIPKAHKRCSMARLGEALFGKGEAGARGVSGLVCKSGRVATLRRPAPGVH